MISLDKIVRDKLFPKFKNQFDPGFNLFKVYQNKNYGPKMKLMRNYLVKILKNIIKDHKKVAIEGSLTNHKMIREIFGKIVTLNSYLLNRPTCQFIRLI